MICITNSKKRTVEEFYTNSNIEEAIRTLLFADEGLNVAIKRLGQEQKTGHWTLLTNCLNSGYYCSECHKKVVKEGWSDTVKKIKYCPNCGTKMESEVKKC